MNNIVQSKASLIRPKVKNVSFYYETRMFPSGCLHKHAVHCPNLIAFQH